MLSGVNAVKEVIHCSIQAYQILEVFYKIALFCHIYQPAVSRCGPAGQRCRDTVTARPGAAVV